MRTDPTRTDSPGRAPSRPDPTRPGPTDPTDPKPVRPPR